jgi:signal transduction histidine kinase
MTKIKSSSVPTEEKNNSTDNFKWIEISLVGILKINKNCLITKANEAFFKKFLTTVDDVVGFHLSKFFPQINSNCNIHKFREFILERDEQLLQGMFDIEGLKTDGSTIPIAMSPNWVKEGRSTAGIIMVRDNTISRKQQIDFANLKQTLELKVALRTIEISNKIRERDAAQKQLKNTLKVLQQTQEELINSEKMSALGQLVAGVAHEINTPIGIGLTGITHLDEKVKELEKKYLAKKMGRNDLESFFKSAYESSAIILSNIRRASALIRSFKNIAVDQSTADQRKFNLKDYLDEIVLSMKPALKKTNIHVEIECPENLELNTFPGALAQIITNLINNSLLHAFEGQETGCIKIGAEQDEVYLNLTYSDNGKGMNEDTLGKIFDPFFTTKRGQGGSGLGMHLVFNLATTLRGKITVKSTPNQGAEFTLTIPIEIKESD